MPELSTGQVVNAGQRCYAILEDGTRGRAEQNADRFHPERHRQPAKDHFGGTKTSLATVKDGGGIVGPAKLFRSEEREILARIIHDSTSFSSPRRARAPSTSPDLIRIGV